jgi:hypothetical protein
MAVKLLWYLTSPDGPYPWLESGRWDTDYEHLQQIAITADRSLRSVGKRTFLCARTGRLIRS